MKPTDYNRTERAFDRIIRTFQDKPNSADFRNATTAKEMLQTHADQFANTFVPNLDMVVVFARSEDDRFNAEDTLSPEQWAFIWHVDERATIRQIGAKLGWDDGFIRRVVYSLLGTETIYLANP
ncbi:MAG: hypothetical protein HY862_08835 [Chloroflexi bacterium]|nr:hypothetical protein [Chloroflexota bacterium]